MAYGQQQAQEFQGRDSPLGIITKFRSTPEKPGISSLFISGTIQDGDDTYTDDLAEFHKGQDGFARLERFFLQSVVRQIMPQSRTARCLRVRTGVSTGAEIWKSTKHGKAHYKGLQVCGSVWACPVCSSKISERRRVELKHATAKHAESGGRVLLRTRTFPHQLGDDLSGLLNAYKKASHYFQSGRPMAKLRAASGWLGEARALETTYGKNGFHPHGHDLIFVSEDCDIEALEDAEYGLWASACKRAGLDIPSRDRGLKLQAGDAASKYITKWGLEDELTQWHKKTGKHESRSPFDFLRGVLKDENEKDAALFRIYAESFQGRHQLQWTRGLRDLFDLANLDDEEIAAQVDDESVRLAFIPAAQWRKLLRRSAGNDLRGVLLHVAEGHGYEGLRLFLAGFGIDILEGTP